MFRASLAFCAPCSSARSSSARTGAGATSCARSGCPRSPWTKPTSAAPSAACSRSRRSARVTRVARRARRRASMRCSFGHRQVSFHRARAAGFHVRASDGSETNYRAYCDKHSPVMAERDRARGCRAGDADAARNRVGAPAVFRLVFRRAAPTSLVSAGADGPRARRRTGRQRVRGSEPRDHAAYRARHRVHRGPAPRALRASALTAESTASLEATASALRRARLELTKGLALCRAVLRRETVKRAVARAGADVARARFGGAPITETNVSVAPERCFEHSNDLTARAPTPSPGPSVETSPGPSGVAPVAPGRARSRATRGKPRTPKPDPDGGGEKGASGAARSAAQRSGARCCATAGRRTSRRRVVVSVGCARVDFFYRFGFDRHLSSSSSATSTGAPRPPHVICSAFTVRDLDNADARDARDATPSPDSLPGVPPVPRTRRRDVLLAFAAAAPSHARARLAHRVARGNPASVVTTSTRARASASPVAAATTLADEVRPDFTILEQDLPESGKRLVYLDSAASSQKPSAVIDAHGDYYRHDNANVHRARTSPPARPRTRTRRRASRWRTS